MGGAGAAVESRRSRPRPAILHLGLPDKTPDQGDCAQLLALCGLDAQGIAASIRQRFGKGEPRLVVNN